MFAASAATKTAKMALAAKITLILSPRTTRYTRHAALKTYDVWSDVWREVRRKKNRGLISAGALEIRCQRAGESFLFETHQHSTTTINIQQPQARLAPTHDDTKTLY